MAILGALHHAEEFSACRRAYEVKPKRMTSQLLAGFIGQDKGPQTDAYG